MKIEQPKNQISKTGKTCLNIGDPSSKAKYDI